ncbi:MAG: hypothetical protein ACO3WU_07005 [Ilumatobacteraceae bacterium]
MNDSELKQWTAPELKVQSADATASEANVTSDGFQPGDPVFSLR